MRTVTQSDHIPRIERIRSKRQIKKVDLFSETVNQHDSCHFSLDDPFQYSHLNTICLIQIMEKLYSKVKGKRKHMWILQFPEDLLSELAMILKKNNKINQVSLWKLFCFFLHLCCFILEFFFSHPSAYIKNCFC